MACADPGCDFALPYPVQFKGSALAANLLRWFGWQVEFVGLPTRQGVLMVYPHTSNWDFVVMVLAKWTLGVTGHVPGNAAPIRLLDPCVPRTETVVQ